MYNKKDRISYNLFFLVIFISSVINAQTSLKGIVIDTNDKTPLIGVTVLIKGTSKGTTTGFDGKFDLLASKGDTLQFSYLGYKEMEYVVKSFSFLTINLSEDSETLSEIVVIGYGSTKIKDVTGSLTSISKKDFNIGNIVTPENLLQGRVAGLSINTGGAPGSGSTIRIRGGASLNASNDPLIVLDGLPIENNTIGGSRSILSTINPNDIESFTILKDASATAIYGSRASNGVIIITTKRGTSKLKVNFDSGVSYNTLPNKIDVFSADEFREIVQQNNPALLDRLGNADTDWQDAIYENTVSSNVNLSINGAMFKDVPTRLSLGRSLQNGLRLTSAFERNSISFSSSPSFFDSKLKISLNANYSFERNRFAAGQEGNAITFDPTQPVFDENSPFGGYFQYYNDDNNGILNQNDLVPLAPFNPVAELLQRKSISNVNRLYGNLKFDYSFHFIPELSLVVNLGIDKQESTGSVIVSDLNPLTQNDGRIVGSSLEYENSQENLLLDGYFKYNKSLSNGLTIDLTTGYSYQKFKSNRFNTNELLDDGVDSEPVISFDPNLTLIGFFSRLNLTLKEKYLLTISYRRDGSSRFSSNNRWGNFPSMALGWKINEDLFSENSKISLLKLRLSWGSTGQQDIGRNNLDLFLDRYIRGLPASQYQFGNTAIPIGIPAFRNEQLKWETTTTYNLGIDFGFLDDRYEANLDLFRKKSSDLLVNAAVSDGSNFTNSGFQNIGEFTSQGIELTLRGDVVKGIGDEFNLRLNFNTSIIRTEITNLFQNEDLLVGGIAGGTGNNAQIHRVGFTPYSFYVFKQVYDANGFPIEGTYADLNNDNVINDDDKYIHHNNTPSISLGFASNMSYKNFDFSFNVRAVLGNYVYNNVNSSRAQFNLIENNLVASNLPTSVLNTNFNTTENVILSDIFIENASFLRIDNVTLGYTFNEVFKTNANFRLSISGQNLMTITNYSGLDPEVFNNGIDNTLYPRPRTFLINANIQF